MPKPLTAVAIQNLKPKRRRYEVSDGGCLGLRVVVFPTKRKSFVCRFRFKGHQRKLTLGPVLIGGDTDAETALALGAPLSLAAARRLATKHLHEARQGTDPCAQKQRKRQEERAAEFDTLAAVVAEYLKREGKNLRTLSQREADLKIVTDELGRLPVADIKRSQYVRILDDIADTRGEVRSDRVLSAMKTLLAWHSGRGDAYTSVLIAVKKRTSSKERARSRILTDDELRAVWRAAGEDDGPFGPFVKFTLLAATRRGESAGLHRDELKDGIWTIPAARYKTGVDMVIPLSPAAKEIVDAMPDRGPFVFGHDGARELGNFTARKAAFDAACGVTGWTLHDVRRSARSLMSRRETGISSDVAERCLGHVIGGVRGVYDRFEYFDEKRHAFVALAALVARIIDPPSGDVVVPMEKKKRTEEDRQAQGAMTAK